MDEVENVNEEQWLGGFFDAEGYIGTRPYKNNNYKNNFTLIPSCQINQAYVAGYFDGEGCIACTVFKVKDRKIDFEIQPNPRINSRDFDVLEKISLFLKSKGINTRSYYNPRKMPDMPQKQLVIYGLANVKKFLILILPFLHSKKREQTNIMLERIIPLMENREHLNKKGFVKIMECVDEMNSSKGGGTKSKYNSTYFKRLWGNLND